MIPQEETYAIEQFIIKCTLPIIYEHEGVSMLWGTGALFEIDDRIFVVTARHLFDDLGERRFILENLSFPEKQLNSRLYTFGKCSLFKPTDTNIDIAILELRSEETIQKLKSNWEFLGLQNVSEPSENGIFFLSGFPGDEVKSKEKHLSGKLLTFYSERLKEIPRSADSVKDGVDYFFKYGKVVSTLEGKDVDSPKLQGTSGAAVWEYRSSSKAIWAVEDCIRVVGVQSGFLHTHYFRAKSWRTVVASLNTIDRGLAQKIESVL